MCAGRAKTARVIAALNSVRCFSSRHYIRRAVEFTPFGRASSFFIGAVVAFCYAVTAGASRCRSTQYPHGTNSQSPSAPIATARPSGGSGDTNPLKKIPSSATTMAHSPHRPTPSFACVVRT
jgi:hypothetical protein